jgi:hypothetical protein
MYLYTYEISIYDTDANSNCGHTGIVFADSYASAIHYIEDVYTGRSEFLGRIELREFDTGLAPCLEMPTAIVKDLINNEGDFKAVVDV